MEAFGALMAVFTLGAGGFLTCRLGFFQFTHLLRALRRPFERSASGAGVSPFQAMATALGASIGTANIAGVAGAILLAGPGAVFWMWIAGLVGMATKLCEITLAIRYRETRGGRPFGGPMLYIERGLGAKARPLAVCFAVFCCLASLMGTALVQPNTIAEACAGLVSSIGFRGSPVIIKAVLGGVIMLLTGAVIFGGAKRIGRFSERAVPFMALVYGFVSLAVLIANRERLLPAFGAIFSGAFGIRPAAGGLMGAGVLRAFRVGTARGVYSNEAGVGSSPMAHAGSNETDPVKQGLLGVFEVFADTIVMCTLTALVILTSGADISGCSSGMALAGRAFASVLGGAGASAFLSVCVLLFAFTSLTGWSLYGEQSAEYLFGPRAVAAFRVLFLLLIPAGALCSPGIVWRLGECFNYLMALPNVVSLLLLSGTSAKLVLQYKMFENSKLWGYNKG